MDDDRRVGELSLTELEAIVQERRHLEQARQFAESNPDRAFHPLTFEPTPPRARRRWFGKPRNWRDLLLLVVEVAAAVGLVAVVISSLSSLQTLNDQVVQAQHAAASIAAPRAAASTPSGSLPGSSYPPTDGNNNELPGSSAPPDQLPAALGVEVQPVPALAPPTPGPQSPSRIVISKLGLDWPIVEGDSWEELKLGVGHHPGSVNPGERGNLVLSGHDDVFGEVFKDLNNLEDGDEITIYAGAHAYRYAVRAKRVVSPSELSVLGPSREAITTLITCTPYMVDTMRLIVIAQLVP